jgi:methanogenic corrinoid protein MtbC1
MRLLTPKDLAQAIGSSESSVRRWIDGGRVRVSRTMGGHRRITVAEAVRFIRELRVPLLRPDLLGLPPRAATTPAAPGGTSPETEGERAIAGALEAGDADAFGAQAIAWYVSGRALAELFDGPVRGVMNDLGARWREEEEMILAEHRATEACLRAVAQVRMLMPEPPTSHAPLAIGGAVEGDTHALASAMAAAVLAEVGYRDVNFGGNTPVKLLSRAAGERRPRLVWLAVHVPLEPRVVRAVDGLTDELHQRKTALVVGGVYSSMLRPHPGRHVAKSMGELAAFARGLNGGAGVE